MREEIIEGDDDSENIIGALARMVQPRLGRQAARGNAVTGPRFTAAQIATQVGGGGKESKLRAPLGLGYHEYTAAGTFSFIVEPQEAFRGERLMIAIARDGAAGSIGLVTAINVGTMPQQPSTEFGIPIEMFSPEMTDANMGWQICPAGTKIQITVQIVGTFAEGDVVRISCGIYGDWIRG